MFPTHHYTQCFQILQIQEPYKNLKCNLLVHCVILILFIWDSFSFLVNAYPSIFSLSFFSLNKWLNKKIFLLTFSSFFFSFGLYPHVSSNILMLYVYRINILLRGRVYFPSTVHKSIDSLFLQLTLLWFWFWFLLFPKRFISLF